MRDEDKEWALALVAVYVMFFGHCENDDFEKYLEAQSKICEISDEDKKYILNLYNDMPKDFVEFLKKHNINIDI